jgi:hypothetical protein
MLGGGAGPGLQPVVGHITTAVRPVPRRPLLRAVEAVVIATVSSRLGTAGGRGKARSKSEQRN